MTPQEKKAHSLKKDCRNTYGENDKSSRKSIRFRKRWVNRTFRRESNQTIDSSPVEAVQDDVAEIQKKNWKKSPDSPLGQKLLRKQTWAIERNLQQASQADPKLIDDLHEYLTQHNLGTQRLKTTCGEFARRP